MKRLSSPLVEMRDFYDVVVIGSGYGGAIAASRFARAGRRVCLLERGQERLPGEFPHSLPEALPEIQVNRRNLSGGDRARGALYDFRVGPDINVFLGCGLGGTSLVNAGVSLRADRWVFEDPRWPAELRQDADTSLEAGYRRAEEMLKPAAYPETAPRLRKLEALEKSGTALGGRFYRPPINVNFQAGTNHTGVEQSACHGCGDCVTGCNTTAKNTLLMNYLPDAKNHGAEIFCGAEVIRVSRAPDGRWLAHYHALRSGREAFDAPTLTVAAEMIVLGAGALGSTEILLRSRRAGLALSPRLGQRFTGNGDVLAFGYNCDQEINGVGFGTQKAAGRAPVGPCITGIVDLRGAAAGENGMVIEEGSLPGSLAAILPGALAAAAAASGTDTDSGFQDRARELTRQALSAVPGIGPWQGALRNTQTYLVMSHDDAGGAMSLEADGNSLRIDWPGAGAQPGFRQVDSRLLAATTPLGGTFVRNPMWKNFLRSQGALITVHPLGGCPMGGDGAGGVVDHKGQVFAGDSAALHEGLFVSDGSIIPRSLGVNPLLTICALAERSCALVAAERGWNIDYTLPSRPGDGGGSVPPPPVGIQFTETMRGFFAANPAADFRAAEAEGKARGQSLEFTLTIQSEDLKAMLSDPRHEARMFGTVTAPLLSPGSLEVRGGRFTLLDRDPAAAPTRRMTYRMRLLSLEGREFFFHGFKTVRNDQLGFDLWADTTTLYVTLHAGADETAPPLGRGILTIAPVDFARQLGTMQALNAPDPVAGMAAVAEFGRFFAGSLWSVFGPLAGGPGDALRSGFKGLTGPGSPPAPPRRKRPLRAPLPEIHDFPARDGVPLRLTRYQGGSRGPVILVHGLGVSSLIFSIDTIGTNLVEHLCEGGYDVWNLDMRASIALPSSRGQFSGDDIADKDYPAAVEHILQITGAPSLQAVVHCFGSTTWFMSMLGGLEGVRSIVASQIAVHTVGTPMTQLKTGLHVPEFLNRLGVSSLNAYAGLNPGWRERLLDAALRAYPIPFREWCGNEVCRRIAFMYAPLYRHANINTGTHAAMREMFGEANIQSFEHIALIARRGVLVGADGSDRYLPRPERLNLPITFLHGGGNECFAPESTQRTFDWLSARFGPGNYARHVIDGYGHIDCIFGHRAAVDVFPLIRSHLDKHGL